MPHTRRSVIQAAAWATPAVIVATVAPAVAASPPGTLTLTPTPFFTFESKQGGYSITVTNNWNRAIQPGTLTFTLTLLQGGTVNGYTGDGNWTLNTQTEADTYVFTDKAGLNAGDTTGSFVTILTRAEGRRPTDGVGARVHRRHPDRPDPVAPALAPWGSGASGARARALSGPPGVPHDGSWSPTTARPGGDVHAWPSAGIIPAEGHATLMVKRT